MRRSRADSAQRSDRDESISLRRTLAAVKFFHADDVRFHDVAESAETAQPGDLVVYRIGKSDPSELIAQALARGAAGILTEQLLPCPLPQCIVGDVELAMADITARMLNHPDRRMLTIGVIGSAGKTTTSLLISSLLRGSGARTAYQTDLGECDGIVQSVAHDSVPAGASLVQWLGDAIDSQCQAAVVELSDNDARHGLYDAVEFDILVVTGTGNVSCDFGPSGLQCLLERLKPTGVVVSSADDAKALRVIRDSDHRVVTYGLKARADLTAKIIDQSGGMTTLMITQGDTSAIMETALCGAAMASNHAAAAVVGMLIDQPMNHVAEVLSQLRSIPGRVQRMADV
ncbi:MAG: hypothetical protein HKN47_13510 [Pirellulaceae bacterium]|nr:hypothetical protein [Pirellulaceae bacterium]